MPPDSERPGLFDGYALGSAWDEMLAPSGKPRTPYKAIHHTLGLMSSAGMKHRAEALARSYLDQGVTFDHSGQEQPFPLDVVPRVISAHEWAIIESGVIQRVGALEAFLDDIYGREGEVPRAVHEGIIPWRLIASSHHYHRAVVGVRPANGVRAHVAGVDLVRDQDGTFRVLEDNIRVPSGVSYVIANRRAMANIFPEAFATMRIRSVRGYPRMLLDALRAAAPDGTSDPTVVVLTPGVFNSAYFDHALLSRMMGVELVEGRDLVCSGGQVRMRTTHGERPVDVIYRRVDDEFIDPVHFRGDSVLGCAGIVSAMRVGRVTLANAVGNGVADDKLIYTYLPDLIRFYLDEDPILPNVDMGLPGDSFVGLADVGAQLVFDEHNTSSITGAWHAARENARRARETVSTELWEAINTTWHRWNALGRSSVTERHLSWSRERAALISGIADSTMSHDDAWDFLVLGRSLERADMTARLVANGGLPRGGPPWAMVLSGCGAQQAFMRSQRGLFSDELAATFLVLDREFPRSVIFALAEAERRLVTLSPEAARIGVSDEGRRQLGRVRTSLEYRPTEDIIADLPAQMLRVQRAVTTASQVIAKRYFQTGPMTTWTEELV